MIKHAVCVLFDVAAPRTAFGHAVVGAALIFVWVAGAVILGLFALLTRGQKTVIIRKCGVKINQDYLKSLLEACQGFEGPTFTIKDFDEAGLDHHDKQFEFHMRILNDQGFIELDDGDPGIGLSKSADGMPSWTARPLRLTAAGHQFVEALSNKEVWATIKHSFKDACISTLRDVSIKLLEGYAQQKIKKLLE